MKAIITTYHPYAFNKGSRMVARDSDGNKFMILGADMDKYITREDCHRAAAYGLQVKMKWPNRTLIGGGIKDGMVWVQLPDYLLACVYPELIKDSPEQGEPKLLAACKALLLASDEIAGEFIQHKKAVDWKLVNDAYCLAARAIREAEKGKANNG